MQEEVEQKTFNIVVSTTKLTARTILNAGKAAIQQQQTKMAGGKQSVRMLLRQNRGVSSVEIDKTNIRGLERYAKKYGIDYAIRKDTSEVPPRYLVFFKAPDAEAFHSAFKEYSASLLNKGKRPSVLARLQELVQAAAELPGKVRHKEQERGL
ncbi:MAG: PcfB family protein [Faecalibacterium prausnitzii]